MSYNERPKINAMVVISQGSVTSIEMNEGTGPDDRVKIDEPIRRLIYLRSIIEAEIQNFEKREQQKFLKDEVIDGQ